MKDLILLVEDEKKTNGMLKQALESEEVEVVWATNGKTALDGMERGRFNLIILDTELSDISGDELLRSIRRIDMYVDIIIYTSEEEPLAMKKMINLGVDGYVNREADADLWGMVDIVKAKLAPFSAEEIEQLMAASPDELFQERGVQLAYAGV